jgi:hypothetical protein
LSAADLKNRNCAQWLPHVGRQQGTKLTVALGIDRRRPVSLEAVRTVQLMPHAHALGKLQSTT